MNNQQILFYIVVPVYKAELFLEQCVKSVLNQTYPNWQLILVDDGSPDNSGKMCDDFSKSDERIHTIHQPNQGQIAARTTGNKFILNNRVVNSYAVYLDSDDTIEPDTLEKIASHIHSSNADIVVYNWQRVENGIVKKVNHKLLTGIVKEKRELYKIVFANPFYNSLCIKSIATSLIHEENYNKYFYIRHAEDLLQSLNYYKHCNHVLFTNDVLYNYTVNTSSVTQNICYENYHVDTTVRQLVWNFLKDENVWTDEDFSLYAQNQFELIKSQIGVVSNFRTSIKNKLGLLEEIRQNEYFKMILFYSKNDILKLLLKFRCYYTLLFILKIRRFFSQLKQIKR